MNIRTTQWENNVFSGKTFGITVTVIMNDATNYSFLNYCNP